MHEASFGRGSWVRRPVIVVLSILILGACSKADSPPATHALADSLVLERTLCFGICPEYRLRLTAAGHVDFASRNPGDTARGSDTVPQPTLDALVRRAEAFGFFTLPARLSGDPSLCAERVTHLPSMTVTIYRSMGAKTVEDHHGCVSRSDHSAVDVLRQLREFGRAVDSATGSHRWVRPPRRR